jgi:hypothetical protein
MLSVKWVCVVKVPANGVDGALRTLAKSFQNKGNPIATNVAVHSATITVKPLGHHRWVLTPEPFYSSR